MSSVNARISSFSHRDALRPFLVQIGCSSKANIRIFYLARIMFEANINVRKVECKAPTHEFPHLARVTFRAHNEYKYVVG
jgi:hypothetical protein